MEHDAFYGPANESPGSLDVLLKSGYIITDVAQCLQNATIYDDQVLIRAGISLSNTTNAITLPTSTSSDVTSSTESVPQETDEFKNNNKDDKEPLPVKSKSFSCNVNELILWTCFLFVISQSI